MTTKSWVKSGETCPKCKGETEHLVTVDSKDRKTVDAERCPRCKWTIRLDD